MGPPRAKAHPELFLPLFYALMNNSRGPLELAQVHWAGEGGVPLFLLQPQKLCLLTK